MLESKSQHEFGWFPRNVTHHQNNQKFKQHLRAAGSSLWWSMFRELVADAICEHRAKLPLHYRQETGGRYVRD